MTLQTRTVPLGASRSSGLGIFRNRSLQATSCRTGRRTPTPQRIHVVTGGPERKDITGDAGDSDADMNTD